MAKETGDDQNIDVGRKEGRKEETKDQTNKDKRNKQS